MANLEGYTRYPVERFCSQCENDDPLNLPLGVQAIARNAKFVLTRIRTRDGVNQRLGNAWVGMNMGTGKPVTGLYSFKFSGNGVLPDKQVPMVYDQLGNLKVESPVGSGVLVPVTSAQLALPANSYLQADQTQNRSYLAFTNIANPALQQSVNAVYDLNMGILDPLSMRPVGQTWAKGTQYQVGEVVTPILTTNGGNGDGPGRSFRVSAITTGIAGNVEPAWPGDGGSIVDGGVTWTENTLIFSNVIPPPDVLVNGFSGLIEIIGTNGVFPAIGSPSTGVGIATNVTHGAGGFAAGLDVYVAVTLVNTQGETVPIFPNGTTPSISNSTLNDQLNVRLNTTARNWLSGLSVGFAPSGWKIYVAQVATGAAPPVPANYHLVGGANAFVANTIVNINATGAGAAPPTTNTAAIAPAGNVDSGPRWAGVLFVNRNGYISGYTTMQIVESQFNAANFQMFAMNIAIGPANTAQRIFFITQSGGTSAGPFVYAPLADSYNGIPITATVINDNVTTTGTFNFTDIYLQDLLATTANVQPFFDKIQLPACRSVIHSPTMDRMIYLTFNLPSGAYITPQRDPETIYGSTGLVQVSETDGQNLMGWVHFNGIEYALKEESGHEVNPSADDPSTWQTVEKWTGRGPCGLRAYDVGAHFFGFVHKSGVYVNFGALPEWVSKELGSPDDSTMTTWKRINWNAKSTIWMNIDDDTHELRVGVPLDNALTPTHILKCNYAESIELAPAIHSTIYSKGKFIATASARKWSVDVIPANSCIRANRTILNAPAGLDANTQNSQILFASAFDGSINAITPGVFTDNGQLIDFVDEGVAPAEALKDSRFGGVQAMAGGSGSIGVTVLTGSAKSSADGGVNVKQKELALRDIYVKPGVISNYTAMQEGRGERFRVRFSTTGKPPGTWAEIYNYALYINPVFQVQASGSK